MLRQRVFTAVLLLAGLFAALFFLPLVVWLCVVGVIVTAAAWEWGGFARLDNGARAAFTVIIAALYVAPMIYDCGLNVYRTFFASVLFWALVAPLWLRGLEKPISKGV